MFWQHVARNGLLSGGRETQKEEELGVGSCPFLLSGLELANSVSAIICALPVNYKHEAVHLDLIERK